EAGVSLLLTTSFGRRTATLRGGLRPSPRNARPLHPMTALIAGRYELRSRISKGGMGAVWRAYDRRLRRDVAVKLRHTWIAENEELRRRFAREARVLAPLENEHIVRLYDHGEDGETPFLVMELVDGANLGEAARNRRLSWAETVEIAVPVATALSYAH